jgi:transposase
VLSLIRCGGKQTLGGITKQGNRYIRKLLVLSANSLLRSVSKRKGALADWISALLAKKPARLVTVHWPTSSPGSSGR